MLNIIIIIIIIILSSLEPFYGIPWPLFESNSYCEYGGPNGWKRSDISDTLFGDEPS